MRKSLTVLLLLILFGSVAWGASLNAWWPLLAGVSFVSFVAFVAVVATPKHSRAGISESALASLCGFTGLSSLVGTIGWGEQSHTWLPPILWACGTLLAGLIGRAIRSVREGE